MKQVVTSKKPVFDKDFYLGIRLTKSQVDISKIEKIARENGFREQKERHITVLSEKTFVPLFERFTKDKQEEILEKIHDSINNTSWSFTPKEYYYVCRQVVANGSKESYIRTVGIPGIDQFIREINKILKSDIPFRFPHITLFTKGEAKGSSFYGIPINSLEAFKELTTKRIT